MSKNVVIIGAGVAGVNAATKLVDNNFDGQITIIDMGQDPYLRPYEEVMTGYLGACLLYTSPSPRDRQKSRMPSSA